MELWVRSQNKDFLTKVDEVHLVNDFLCSDTVQLVYINGNKKRLGRYETRERALEILDKIQELLSPDVGFHLESFVFQMPER